MHDMHKIIDFERSQSLHFQKLTGIASSEKSKQTSNRTINELEITERPDNLKLL